MNEETIKLSSKEAHGFVNSLGNFNLVWIQTDIGMVGCGAFDVAALDKFTYPAARVKSSHGGPVTTTEDVLEGIIKDVNEAGQTRGIEVGMTGREALEKL